MRGLGFSLVVGVVVLVALAVGGGSSASGGRAAATPFELQKPICSAQYVPVGRACVDKTSLLGGSTQWVVSDGSAKWTAPGQYEVSYKWNVPQTISGSGGLIIISAAAKQLSGTNRICPAMAAKGGLAVPTGISFCAEAGQTAHDSKPVKLATFTAAPTTTADLVISIQDGPQYIYRYRAAAPATPKATRNVSLHVVARSRAVLVTARAKLAGSLDRLKPATFGAGGSIYVDKPKLPGTSKRRFVGEVTGGSYSKRGGLEQLRLSFVVTTTLDPGCPRGTTGQVLITTINQRQPRVVLTSGCTGELANFAAGDAQGRISVE